MQSDADTNAHARVGAEAEGCANFPTGADPPDEGTGERADGEADEETSVDPLVQQGLDASTFVFEQARANLKQSQDASGLVRVPRADLKAIRKEALSMNRAFFKYVKLANERENRLLVEIHLLRQAVNRDNIDRDANHARVYEFLRRYRIDDERSASGSAAAVACGNNPLHAPTLAATQVDRAMSTAARIEAAIAQLSPTGTVNVHGAGLLTASAR